jgi:hypothetical protein
MRESALAKLRRKRARIHRQLDKLARDAAPGAAPALSIVGATKIRRRSGQEASSAGSV